MIKIINKQKKIKINEIELKKVILKMLTCLGYQKFDIGIFLTTNPTIKRYNKQYRSKDTATDILSFPYHTNFKPGKKIVIKTPEDKNLGDIIISLEYARRAAPDWNRSFKKHLIALLAHGIAHLLNYDHKTDAAFKVMRRVESKLIKTVSS